MIQEIFFPGKNLGFENDVGELQVDNKGFVGRDTQYWEHLITEEMFFQGEKILE